MKYLIAVMLLVSTAGAAPADRICVRNYLGDSPGNPCETFPQAYTYVTPYLGVEKRVCARIYSEFYCQGTKTYQHVLTEDKGKGICSVNYDQPGLANFCEQLPEFYDYAQAAPVE